MLPTPPRSKFYFPALTGLRAIAAWIVFFHHFNPFPKGSALWLLPEQWFTGVALFFVLSGFLICVRYFDRLTLSREWFANYMRNRVARIYPLYFLLTCLTFLVLYFYPSYDTENVWHTYTWKDKLLAFGLNITLLRSLFENFIAIGVRPAWTLTVEEFFYLLAPLLLAGLTRRPKLRLACYAAALLLLGCLLVELPPVFHWYGFFSRWEFLFRFTFFGRCLEFLAGIYLALFLFKRLDTAPTTRPVITLVGGIWIASCWWLMALTNPATQAGIFQKIVLNNIVLVPGLCLLLYGLIKERSLLSRLLASKPFDLLGKSSYAFYLIHYGVINQAFERYVTDSIPVRFIFINLAAIALYKVVEHPLHRLIVKR